MKFCKNIRFILSCLLLSSFVIKVQYCSEENSLDQVPPAPLRSPNKRVRRKSFIIDIQDTVFACSEKKMQTPRELLTSEECFMREALLQKYDSDVIDLWMNRYDLNRIDFHAFLQNETSYAVLSKLVGASSALHDKKDKNSNSLYASQRQKHPHVQFNKDKERERLWLELMYFHKNKIHRFVEDNKLNKSSHSLLAWPVIKEIQKIKKFPLNKK